MSGTTVTGALFMHEPNTSRDSRPRIGSLFSGYGGLDLAVEHVFHAKTVWFSELNEPVARVFARHWPDTPNLGDITTIDWRQVEPVDILIGGFPCQDVSTVGKRAGIAPGTRSGLWAHMAAAIDVLQPEWVVIENVRGLLSSPATRPPTEGDDHDHVQRWGRYADAITRWEHITGRPAPAPALLTDADGPRPAAAFVEWLMGLPTGWVTDGAELTQNQQITALGNGVLPLQAASALTDASGWGTKRRPAGG